MFGERVEEIIDALIALKERVGVLGKVWDWETLSYVRVARKSVGKNTKVDWNISKVWNYII